MNIFSEFPKALAAKSFRFTYSPAHIEDLVQFGYSSTQN